MSREKVLIVSEKMVEYGFYGLIFFLPISKALIETCAGFIILGFLINKIVGRDFSSFKEDALVFWLLLAFFAFNALSLTNSGPLLNKSLKALFCKWAEYLFLFIAGVDHFRDVRRIKRFFSIFIFISVLVGISALTQKFFGFEFFRGRGIFGISVTGPFENPNCLSAYLIFSLLVTFSIAHWRWPRWVVKAGLFFVCVILFTALLLTFSRAGWLGTSAGFVLLSMLLPDKRVSLSALFFFLLALGSYPPFFQRVMFSFGVGGDSLRYAIWQGAIEMIRENPFLGKGLGTFMDYFEQYVPGIGVHYAHNCYLQMWAEAGIFTLIAFLCLSGFIFCRGVRVAFKNRTSDLGILLCGLTAGIFGFLVASFFDTELYSLQLSVLFWVMLGATVALTRVLTGRV